MCTMGSSDTKICLKMATSLLTVETISVDGNCTTKWLFNQCKSLVGCRMVTHIIWFKRSLFSAVVRFQF